MNQSTPQVTGVTFRPIPDKEGYVAGDNGSIWSRWTERHPVLSDQWRPLTQREDRKGYLRIAFGSRENRTAVMVHRLILLAFAGQPEAGQEACHINSDRTDNRPANLRWDTHRANVQDSIEAGTFIVRRGIKNGRARLNEDDVRTIRERHAKGDAIKALARKFGLTPTAVRYIVQRKTWIHVA
jgi:hypothetical protein